MSKYLYGAAVQGIQGFIFKTNELRHIVGASELVEQICTSAFDEFARNGESLWYVQQETSSLSLIMKRTVEKQFVSSRRR